MPWSRLIPWRPKASPPPLLVISLFMLTILEMTSVQLGVEGRPYPDPTTTDDEDMDPVAYGAGLLDGEDCGASGCGPPQYDQEYEQYGDDLLALAGSCELGGCWDLFQATQRSLGLRDEFFYRDHTPPEELRNRCLALRTFLRCIGNMTRCKGDLNFHSSHRGIERQMKQFNCSMNGPVHSPSDTLPGQNGRYPNMAPVCSFNGRPAHKHCGLFGDPHLRTFDDQFQTCKVQGAWPLLDNDHLTVQVTNDPVGVWEGTATATSKLTVVIKRNDECAENRFVTYQAQTDILPGVFDDGQSSFGPEESVKITEVDPGTHVEIYLRYIDTTLIVRQIGRYFTFAAKMPEEIIEESRSYTNSIQLCVKGCPKAERIDYKQFLARKHNKLKMKNSLEQMTSLTAMSRDVAEILCRKANVVDFYFDSCVFDLMTTGDTNFTVAASNALRDVLQLMPQTARMHKNRTDLKEIDREYTSSSTSVHLQGAHRTVTYGRIIERTLLLWCTSLLCLLYTRRTWTL